MRLDRWLMKNVCRWAHVEAFGLGSGSGWDARQKLIASKQVWAPRRLPRAVHDLKT